MNRQPSERRAFTLIELLVVMAIIAVLVGLLLPAVQRVREAAYRTECTNHLKQLSLACINFEFNHRHLPTGGYPAAAENQAGVGRLTPNAPNGIPAVGKLQLWGWNYQILPYMEQENLWALNQGASLGAIEGQFRSIPIKAFFCPSSRAPDGGKMDYAGNGGNRTTTAASVPLGGIFEPGTITGSGAAAVANISVVRSGNIRSGASNTVMIGEKYRQEGAASTTGDSALTFGPWSCDNIRGSHNASIADSGPLQSSPKIALNSFNTDSNSPQQSWGWGSFHPGGMNAAFADGSVRRVSYGGGSAVPNAVPARTVFSLACERNNTIPFNSDDL